MAILRSIDSEQFVPVTLGASDQSLVVNAPITDLSDGVAAINATGGAGGTITIFSSVTGSRGIAHFSSMLGPYDIVIHSGAVITTTTYEGVRSDQTGISVVNHGSINAATYGIFTSGWGRNNILNNGVINAATGILVNGTVNSIVNTGSLYAAVDGIIFTGDGTSFTNSGLIDAHGIGVNVQNLGYHVITNSGAIVGEALGISGDKGVERIVNRGSITGGMDLRSGDDFLDNRLGTINGMAILGEGNDTALGGSGAETISDWIGDDSVDAGGGIDTLTYEEYKQIDLPATIDLRIHVAQNTGWGSDILLNFENVTGTAGNDVLTGDDQDNRLRGIEGSDKLDGGTGNDTLEGGLGNDILQGGNGIDTASYNGNLITSVNLSVLTAQDTGYGADILSGIENVTSGSIGDLLTGNEKANVLIGNGGADALSGAAGNDTLNGGADADVIEGGADHDQLFGEGGDDVMSGDAGDDLLNGGSGNDVLDGGTGANTAVFSGASNDYAIVVNTDGSATVTDKRSGGDGTDSLKNIGFLQFVDKTLAVVVPPPVVDPGPPSTPATPTPTPSILSLNLMGTANADRLIGADAADRIQGFAGNDVLIGGFGDDSLFGGAGRDVLTGGAGHDMFVFDSKPNRKTNIDRVTDFSVADDSIHLSKKIFSKIAKKGVLTKSSFWIGDKAHDANDRLVYNKKSGALFYDDDGKGAHASVQIATLTKKLKMIAADFFVM